MGFYDHHPQNKQPKLPPPEPNGRPLDPVRASRYATAALEAEITKVRTAQEGTRNETLNKAAYALAQLVAAGLLPDDLVRVHLADAAHAAGLEPGEISATIKSGMTKGLTQPRQVELHDPTPDVTVDGVRMTSGAPEHDAAEADVRFNQAVAAKARELRILEAARDKVSADKTGGDLPALRSLPDFLAEPDDTPTYRVAGLWPTGGRVVLSSPNKAGKTTLVGNQLRSLADGDPFLGADVIPAGRVVLLDDELDSRMLRRWLRDHGIANGEAVDLVTMRGRLSTFNILDPATRQRWAQHIGPADVLVLDCLRPALDALGLSEDKDAGRFLEALDELTAEAGIGETLVVHHMGHTGERSRGDSRILDWPDAVWKLVKGPDDQGARYFSAYGRDVDYPETLLGYDPSTRRLSAIGGSRRDAEVDQVLGPVLDLLAEADEALSGRAIEKVLVEAGHPQKKVRDALKRGIKQGAILFESGPNGAHLHYLNPSVRHSALAVRQRGQSECVSASIDAHAHTTRSDSECVSDKPTHCRVCGRQPTEKAGLGASGLCVRCETGGQP
jgi:hypothetical protein